MERHSCMKMRPNGIRETPHGDVRCSGLEAGNVNTNRPKGILHIVLE